MLALPELASTANHIVKSNSKNRNLQRVKGRPYKAPLFFHALQISNELDIAG